MSDVQRWMEFRERVTGKWQIPALALSLLALGLSIATYRSPTSKIPFDDLRDRLGSLLEDGMYTSAIQTAERLLMVPDKSASDLVPVQACLARARLLRAERSGAPVESVGRAVIDHYAQAVDGGFTLEPGDWVLLGKAHDWCGEHRAALSCFDKGRDLHAEMDIDLRRHTAELRGRLSPADSSIDRSVLDAELTKLIADASDRPDILVWAVERRVDLLCDAGRCAEASGLVDRTEPLLGEGPWRWWAPYLRAYTLYRSGEAEEAVLMLRNLRDDVTVRDALHARCGWLLGRLVLGTDEPQRPEEAISFFTDVVSTKSAPEYAAASNLGLAEALVMLERFDEAEARYQEAIASLKGLLPFRHLDPKVIEASLTVVSERLRHGEHLEAALRFARMAVEVRADDESAGANAGEGASVSAAHRAMLLGRLSDLQAAVARMKRSQADALEAEESSRVGESSDGRAVSAARLRTEARQLLLESAASSQRIAELVPLTESQRAAAAWTAAERVNESGDQEAIVEAMDQFVRYRSSSPYVSRALRYRGQAQQSLNRFEDAVATYRENLQRFPRTPDAGSSLIPLARCFLAMGPEYADQAEKTLRVILDDSDVFTPQAPEYADALFLLGDLLNRNGAYERAIPVLEEAMQRYPADDRAVRARFLLGDCYRQSGLALKGDLDRATFAAQRERIAVEQKSRLRTAADLFSATVADYEARGENARSPRDEIYLRHARLYQADCLFELGEFDEALAEYERSAWIYRGTTTALAAYVQIINCHVFAGDGAEAQAAIRRALYLVETLPADTFAEGVGLETREDWRNYFEWVQQLELF